MAEEGFVATDVPPEQAAALRIALHMLAREKTSVEVPPRTVGRQEACDNFVQCNASV